MAVCAACDAHDVSRPLLFSSCPGARAGEEVRRLAGCMRLFGAPLKHTTGLVFELATPTSPPPPPRRRRLTTPTPPTRAASRGRAASGPRQSSTTTARRARSQRARRRRSSPCALRASITRSCCARCPVPTETRSPRTAASRRAPRPATTTGLFRKVDSLRRQRRSAAARRYARFARAARPFCAPRVAADSCGARARFSPASESPAVFSLRPLTCSQKKVLLAKTRNLLCPFLRRKGQERGKEGAKPVTCPLL